MFRGLRFSFSASVQAPSASFKLHACPIISVNIVFDSTSAAGLVHSWTTNYVGLLNI